MTDFAASSDPFDPVVMIHRDAAGAVTYWRSDGQGWTAERREAMEYETLAEANLAKKQIRRWHPGITTTAERMP